MIIRTEQVVMSSDHSHTQRSPTILIVESTESLRYDRRSTLSDAGYRIIEASTGEEAVLLAAAERPDLIVLDLKLSGIDGIEVCRRLKSDPDTSHIMVLQISASHTSQMEPALGLKTGADGYLIEPVDPVELLATVKMLVRLGRVEKENRQFREMKVKRNLTLYHSIFSNATESIAVLDSNGKYIEQNLTHRIMHGYPDEELIGQTPALHLGVEIFERIAKELVDTGRFRGELRSRRKDGHWVDVTLSAFGIYDDHGKVVCYVGIEQDITERKKAEETTREIEDALRSAHDSLRHLVEQSPFGIYAVDADFRLVQVSVGAQKVFRNVRPLLGRDFSDVLRQIWPEPFANEAIARFRHTLRTGEPYRSSSTVQRRQDIDEIESYDWKIERLTLPDGRLGVVCHFYDLSERQRYETALRESETRLHHMADNAPVMVWVTEPDGTCSFLSRSWYDFTGQAPETSLGFGWTNALHPDDRPAAEQTFIDANKAHIPFKLEYRLRRHDGEYRWAIDAATPRVSSQGDFLGYIGSVIDITERRQAEHAVRESEERFRQLSTSLPLLAWTCRPDGSCDFLSPQWGAYTGIPVSAQLGYEWLNSLHPDDRSRTIMAWEAAVQADGDFHVEFRIRRHDGIYRWFDTRAVRTRDEHGHTQKWYGFNTDITSRKSIEEALRESETRLRTLADNMSQFAWMADEKGRLFWYNQRWFDYTGTTLDEMQGWGWKNVHHDDHLPRVIQTWQRSLETGEPWQDTFPLRGQDGQFRWFLSRAVPIRDDKGRIFQWFGTNTDITDLREAEQAQAHLAAIVTSSDDAIISIDLTGLVQTWNRGAERLFGYVEHEVVGHSITRIIPSDRTHDEPQILARIKQGEAVEHYETVRRCKDGTLLDISLTVSPIQDDEGRIIGASKVARDISLRKRQEEELHRLKDELEVRVHERTRQLLETQERLMAATSQLSLTEQQERRKLARELHDYLAQMLVVGQMKSKMLKRQAPPSPVGATIVEELNQVFQQALTYTRTLIAELSPPSLHDAGLPSALQWLGERFRKDGLRVAVQVNCVAIPLPEEQAVVVFQAVRELLFNVMKHAGVDEATVTISLHDDVLRVAVVDRGRGSSLEALRGSTEPGHLGLVSVRERFHAMGGRVEAESMVGYGTTVTLVLPLARRAETNVLGPELGGKSDSVLQQNTMIRVLLVDDHHLVRKGLKDILAEDDRIRIVGEAGSCEGALLLAANVVPDVVIMDVNLPDCLGIDATKRFKKHHPQTRVIGLSFHTDDQVTHDMIAAGAEALLLKDRAADELIPRILGKGSE